MASGYVYILLERSTRNVRLLKWPQRNKYRKITRPCGFSRSLRRLRSGWRLPSSDGHSVVQFFLFFFFFVATSAPSYETSAVTLNLTASVNTFIHNVHTPNIFICIYIYNDVFTILRAVNQINKNDGVSARDDRARLKTTTDKPIPRAHRALPVSRVTDFFNCNTFALAKRRQVLFSIFFVWFVCCCCFYNLGITS